MARWGLLLGGLLAGNAVVFLACGDPEREDGAPRYYVPPPLDADATPEETSDASFPPDEEDAEAGDAGGDAEAGPPDTSPLLATGAGFHPDLAVGNGDHTCVVARAADAGPAGAVWCWGANDRGQLGLGTTGDGTAAADVASATRIDTDETGLPFDGIEELALAPWHSCARRQGILFCWGQRFSGAQAEPPSALGPDRTRPRAIGNLDVARIAAGGPHTCVAKRTGTSVCFGHSSFGELGRADAGDPACTAPIFHPYEGVATHTCSGTLLEVPDAGAAKANAVSAGEVHSCALVGDRVRCWGTNLGAQIGRPGTQAAEPAPQEVVIDAALLTPIDGVSMLASGGRHSCALRQGSVYCWGTNDAGELGVATLGTPQRAFAAAVAGIADVVSIGVAEQVTCAVKADKTVWCWGSDIASLPDGGAVVSTPTPTRVKGPGGAGFLGDVVAVAPGFRHVCARKTDGSVWCWGKNDRGQLGDGTKIDNPYPVKVTGLP
jgi:alpha-tubulin suppressor-like RCC1 family protein